MSKTHLLRFDALAPVQSPKLTVFTFVAKARRSPASPASSGQDAMTIGALQGFQRPQIANHIREIRDYLEKPNAILPNAIVVAFMGQARLEPAASPEESRPPTGHRHIERAPRLDRRWPTALHGAFRASRPRF